MSTIEHVFHLLNAKLKKKHPRNKQTENSCSKRLTEHLQESNSVND